MFQKNVQLSGLLKVHRFSSDSLFEENKSLKLTYDLSPGSSDSPDCGCPGDVHLRMESKLKNMEQQGGG